MTTSYKRYDNIYDAPTVPAWSTVWPGFDGCGTRTLSHVAKDIPGPPTSNPTLYYEPEVTVVWKTGSRNNGRTGSKPPYTFTNYSVGRTTTKQYLIRRHYGTNAYNIFYQWGTVPKVGGSCTPTVSKVVQTGPLYSTYDEVSREFPGLQTYERSVLNPGDISTALYDVQNELISEAMSSYDLLTDVAEMREIPKMIAHISKSLIEIMRSLRSRHGSRALKAAASLHPSKLLKSSNKALRKLGGDWMTYRYGIMPLVYSYRDIQKLLKRGQEVRTYKSRTISPTQTGSYLPPSTSSYWVKDMVGNVTVRGEVFQYFTSSEIARLSGLGVNPLVTAWELIPYSFVLDWFVNVGNYIAARTCQTWARQKWACLSRRDNYSLRTSLHKPQQNYTVTVSNQLPTGWWGSAPPATPSRIIENPEGDYIYNEVVYDSYSRWVIPVAYAPLQYNPSLNWRRLIDTAVLSLNQLNRIVRSVLR